MQGDEAAARAAFTSARVALDSLGAARPTDFRVYGAMGYAYAGLGLANEAVANANRYAREGTGNSTGDVYFTRRYRLEEAAIRANAGRLEEAIDILADLLSVPSPIHVALLRLDPIWDPLRDDPRFQALLRSP